MNDVEKRLITAICQNDMSSAKKVVRIILEGDKTQKNRAFVNRHLTLLNNSAMNLLELPSDLKNLLLVEDVQASFAERRYFLSERERAIAEKILKLDKVNQRLAEIGVTYINSALLYGESGTGKMTFGRYIAYKLQVPFTYLNFSRVIDSYLGSTQKNISKVFDYAKQNKCVLMLDEIDAIGIRRQERNEVGEMSRIVISLMQNMDTLTGDIVLLGATNREDIIDEALMRRFSIKHEVKRLSEEERYQMSKSFLDDVGYVFEEDWLRGICKKDATQAELKNRLIDALVEKYYNEESSGKKE